MEHKMSFWSDKCQKEARDRVDAKTVSDKASFI